MSNKRPSIPAGSTGPSSESIQRYQVTECIMRILGKNCLAARVADFTASIGQLPGRAMLAAPTSTDSVKDRRGYIDVRGCSVPTTTVSRALSGVWLTLRPYHRGQNQGSTQRTNTSKARHTFSGRLRITSSTRRADTANTHFHGRSLAGLQGADVPSDQHTFCTSPHSPTRAFMCGLCNTY